jgi:HEAT repeat protein
VWLKESQLTAAAVPELIAWLADPHWGRRRQAARTLANHDPQPEVIWPALMAARADEDWVVRMQVTRAAVHQYAPPEQAVPILRDLLGDPHWAVQRYAAWALERFGQVTQG